MVYRIVLALALLTPLVAAAQPQRPNIVLIYADDIGYGDLGSYGAAHALTPAVDRLAQQGLRFTHAHAPSATCTPSRYALLTGEYAWRKPGTGILPGDAALIIAPGRPTLPAMLRAQGYATGAVGKWHLGLGTPEDGPNWNGVIAPGPLEIGFDEAFLVPATGDRVPTVYLENHRIVRLDPADPIRVSFGDPIGDEPTGREHPELLKLHPSHGHDMTIVNGVSRIGYLSGGKAARWVDEDMADTLAARAVDFIARRRSEPFFLYFATHDIHVPRMPHPRFQGKSGMGARGDALMQFDATVGAILEALDRLGLAENTLVILSSDNGPVVDDGYRDEAVEKLGAHRPAGPLRGGKYSAFEGGTRVPFLVRWPARVSPGVSEALLSHVDLYASLAALTGARLEPEAAPDSFDLLAALTGRSGQGREWLVGHGASFMIERGDWKYILPSKTAAVQTTTNTETGGDPAPQIYNLRDDPGERRNLAEEHPERVQELRALLERIRGAARTRP